MADKILVKGRRWLSTDVGTGSSISWAIEDWGDEGSPLIHGEVTLRDCTRSITYFFEGKKDKAKLNRLIEELEKFRDARYPEE